MLHLVVISSQYSLVCDKFLYLSLFSWPWQFWRILVQHFEKHPLFHIWYETPVQARWTTLDAWGWCTGTTQRDGMGREEGGGPSTGNMCTPAADPCWHMTKPIQHCKAKKKTKQTNKKKASLVFFSWSEPPWGYDFCDEPQVWCVLLITSWDLWYQCDDLTTGETEFDHLVKVGCLRFPYCNITVLPLSPLYSL